MIVMRSTVTAAIDATQDGGSVEIQYVRKDGSISPMRIAKQKTQREPDASPTAKAGYNVRSKGLIRVLDLEENQPKSLIIFCIVAYRPGPDHPFYPVRHE